MKGIVSGWWPILTAEYFIWGKVFDLRAQSSVVNLTNLICSSSKQLYCLYLRFILWRWTFFYFLGKYAPFICECMKLMYFIIDVFCVTQVSDQFSKGFANEFCFLVLHNSNEWAVSNLSVVTPFLKVGRLFEYLHKRDCYWQRAYYHCSCFLEKYFQQECFSVEGVPST